ncbi:Nn.00g088490.m01.CDS01 [Neocucurbitaria sp. VM-36]
MSRPTQITAHESSTIPPQGLNEFKRLRWSVKNPPVDPDVTFAGKTVLVTGANIGLGLEAAVKYAQKGASKLILAVRSSAKGEEAKAEILHRSARKDQDFITILLVDLSTFSSVQLFIEDLDEETKDTGLHIALLNAGLANPSIVRSEYGYEMALQVNVLSTALMAILLLPLLHRASSQGSDKPHLTFVNSVAHTEPQRAWYAATKSLFAYANDPPTYDLRKHYGAIKLLGISVMLHIAHLVSSASPSPADPDIIVNACCPYLCRTNLGRNFSLPMRKLSAVSQYFTARTAEEGARTLVSATVLGKESHGAFWTHDVLRELGQLARDEAEMEKCVWEIAGAIERFVPGFEEMLKG